ncbi:MAG: glycosyltransferase family 2 protein [Armatimonadota bacterium]
MHSVTAIIPAYNEATRIQNVLEVVRSSSLIDEILVVDDGSADNTTEVAERLGFRVVRLPENRGKGSAMRSGAIAARGDLLLFLDADLRGLTPAQVDSLIAPVHTDRAEMTIGIFRGGRTTTDLAQVISPNISGQRCLYRDFFLSAPLIEGSRSGVEIALTIHARANGQTIEVVPLDGATHVMKEEKMGFWRGTAARYKMYSDILITLARYHLLARHLRRAPVGNE